MLEGLSIVFLSVATLQAPSQDGAALEREARRAAARYESLLHRRAPTRFGSGAGSRCDEIIGRFCFRFSDDDEDDASPPDTVAEHPDIPRTRHRAIAAYRAWLSHDFAEERAVAPLLRYLVEDDRPREALAAARTHAWAAGGDTRSLLLLGLALHEAGEIQEAEAVFDSARVAMPEPERRRLDDVAVLLEPRERSWYRRLTGEEREAYHRRFWRFADPSLLDPGNERRSAHYARHAWAMILEKAPRAEGTLSWGDDREEILLRYGLPVRRERLRDPWSRAGTPPSMVQIYDPEAVSFVPPRLGTDGIATAPEPALDPEPALERVGAPSAYAPLHVDRLATLSVQAARFPVRGGAVLVASGRLPLDRIHGPAVAPAGLLVALDTAGRELARGRVRAWIDADSAVRVSGEIPLGTGAWVYRLEVKDEETRQVGLAQYRTDIPVPVRPSLSDLLLAEPDTASAGSRSALTPLGSALIPRGSRVLIWAEARGLARSGAGEARYAVEWWVEPAEPGTPLARAARWLSQRLGLGTVEGPPGLRWTDRSAEEPVPISFVVDFAGLDPGLYRLGLVVRDQVTNREAQSARLLRVVPASESYRRDPD